LDLQSIRYLDLAFDREMLFARRGDGSEIRFTRQERALLLQLAHQPGKLQTRDRLIELLTRDGSDASERNIDFLINRLRKRLGDSARNPRFIATQYSEGYIWIATPNASESCSAFLVIGPVYGLRASGAQADDALELLTDALEGVLGRERAVVYLPDWSPSNFPADGPTYSLDASFHNDGAVLHAAFVLRHGPARSVIGAFRAKFDGCNARGAANNLADEVKTALWAHLALPRGAIVASVDTPLDIRMHDAARLLSRTPASWHENEKQLAQARAANPDDPTLAIMRGLNLYARLLQHVLESDGPMTESEWAAIEDEIEALALASLPRVGDNPLLMLAVAKLLFFIDRGHGDLAARLADEAFENSTAFAAAFALQGQIRACQGHLDEALGFYDKAIAMSEPGSEFHIYLLTLKLVALLAANKRAAQDQLTAELYAMQPALRVRYGLMLASPKLPELAPDLEAMLAMLDEARARKLIHYFFNICARRFCDQSHRRNVMQGLLTHMVRRFGPTIVPAPIEKALGYATW
jgi:DNA-binding winged helix-turn-helix (wHTH) protein